MSTEGEAIVSTTDASAAAVSDTGTPAPVVNTAEADLEGFRQAVANAEPEDGPAPAKIAEAAASVVDQADKAAAEAEPVKTPEEIKAATERAATDAETAKIEDEIKSLNLKETAQVRFRELSKRPTQEAMDKVVAPLLEIQKKHDAWVDTIQNTGVSPTQWGQIVNYATMVNDAERGNIKAIEAAHQRAQDEVIHWARLLGKEAPGVDPLTAHADLVAEVEQGDITRARALEMVNLRAVEARRTEATDRNSQTAQLQTAQELGRESIITLQKKLKTEDPIGFMAKLEIITPLLSNLASTTPPDQWAAKAEAMFRAVKLPTAQLLPTPGPTPLRPTGASSTTQQREVPKDGALAFRQAYIASGGQVEG